MTRKPKPNASEYLRRVLNIPITRPMTGHEIQRLDFAEALLVFIIKGRITRKEMAAFIKSYAWDNGMLPKVCYNVLKTLKDQTIIKYDDFYKVDGTPLNNFNKAWWASLKAAGIKDFHFHELRHTFCSNLIMSGGDLKDAKEMIGHADISMTDRYSHLTNDHKFNKQRHLASYYDSAPQM